MSKRTFIDRRPEARTTYRPPVLTRWGDLRSLTRGSTGGTSDGNLTGSSETFHFLATDEWYFHNSGR